MGSSYTVYNIDIRPGQKFVGITANFNARMISDLADAALETPRTWHGAEMKDAGVSDEQAFRIVRVCLNLSHAVKMQEQTIQLFIDAFGSAWYEDMPRGYNPDDEGDKERLDVTIYKCSGCRYFSTKRCDMRTHFKSSKCTNQVVDEYRTHFIARCVPRPANPLAHVDVAMASRIPSGLSVLNTRGIEERTKHMMSSPEVLHECFLGMSCVDISLKIFTHLWGSQAPRRFQTVFTYDSAMYDLGTVEDPSDPATVALTVIEPMRPIEYDAIDQPRPMATIKFNDFIINLYKALENLAFVVSERCRDDRIAYNAKEYREELCGTSAMTTLDVLTCNARYFSGRKNDYDCDRFAKSLQREVKSEIQKTRLAFGP